MSAAQMKKQMVNVNMKYHLKKLNALDNLFCDRSFIKMKRTKGATR
jgi:hypothetical protein